MRESELCALYLLRQQQLGLFTLWKTSQLGTYNNSFILSTALLDDVKFAVLKQISFNKQIQ
jgi:peptide-O-fucosyltransferase